MPFHVLPLDATDFSLMSTYTPSTGGDFVTPALALLWTATTARATSQRNLWSLDQQRWFFEHDPSAHFVKVVDSDSDEIISLARWHRYTGPGMITNPPSTSPTAAVQNHGNDDDDDDNDRAESSGPEVYLGLTRRLGGDRAWMGTGLRWVLTTLVTRQSFRRRGAGEMLVRWGIEQARKDGCNAYLEAAATAVSLYQKCGFQVVLEVEFDLADFGFETPLKLARMKWTFNAEAETETETEAEAMI